MNNHPIVTRLLLGTRLRLCYWTEPYQYTLGFEVTLHRSNGGLWLQGGLELGTWTLCWDFWPGGGLTEEA